MLLETKLLECDQKRVYEELNGKMNSDVVQDGEKSKVFGNDIWGVPKTDNGQAEWLGEVRRYDVGIYEL